MQLFDLGFKPLCLLLGGFELLLEKTLLRIPGVVAAHDLHVWTITSGTDSFTGHVVVSDMKYAAAVLKGVKAILEEKFKIDHVTIQVENEEIRMAEPTLRV